jgi:phosphatidylinositol alpha 1,6-mannosyltransferase
MRIALTTETWLPSHDGITRTLCRLLEHLEQHGHEALLFAPEGGDDRYGATRVVGLPARGLPVYPGLRLAGGQRRLAAELSAFAPDLLHLIGPVWLGRAALRRGRELGLPVISSYHTDLPAYTGSYGLPFLKDFAWTWLRWLHNQTDRTLAPSHFTRAQLEAQGFLRLGIWGGGVDCRQFHPGRADAAWRLRLSGGEPERPLLLCVSRLAAEKRIEWLRALLDARPDLRLALVGDGPHRRELERHFAGTPTVFTGHLDGDALAAAYASADLFVFPSVTETFGNVVLEAMASGLPVVAADAGGPVDQVLSGINGTLFAAGDPLSLQNSVAALLADPQARLALGRSARRYAETQPWEACLDGLLEEYSRLAARPQARALAAG